MQRNRSIQDVDSKKFAKSLHNLFINCKLDKN